MKGWKEEVVAEGGCERVQCRPSKPGLRQSDAPRSPGLLCHSEHLGPALCFPCPPRPAASASLDPTLWSGSRPGPPGPSTERVNLGRMREQGEGCAGSMRRSCGWAEGAPLGEAGWAPPLPAPILEASGDTWPHGASVRCRCGFQPSSPTPDTHRDGN